MGRGWFSRVKGSIVAIFRGLSFATTVNLRTQLLEVNDVHFRL